MLRTFLFDLDAFFEQRASDPGMLAPAAIVVLAGLATMSGTLAIIPELTTLLSGVQRRIARIVMFVGSIGGGIGLVSLWFVYAGSFHTVSLLFDGEGPFRRVFLLTGWGFAPQIVAGLFGGLALYHVVGHATLPSDPAQLSPFLRGLQSRPPLLVSWIVRQVLLGWQAVIWTFAVKHARNLTLRESFLTVGGPVVLTLGWNLHQFLA